MTTLGTPLSPHATRVLLLGSGELGKEVAIELQRLGAEVIALGVSPNGTNINEGVGSTHPEAAAQAVRDHGAHLGISLDGDADRVMIIDETGAVADGDQIMALLAGRWADAGRLRGARDYRVPDVRRIARRVRADRAGHDSGAG